MDSTFDAEARAEGHALALEIARGWWTYILRGIFAIIFGVAAWIWPDITITILVVILGTVVIMDGGMMLAGAVLGRDLAGRSRLLLAAAGIALIVTGLVIWIWPDITAKIVMILFGVWAAITGVEALLFAIRERDNIPHEWLLGFMGLAATVFGVLVIIFPGAGAISLIWLIGLFSIIFGVALIAVGFDLRSAKNQLEQSAPGTA
jgi:uncharacterized membrane protein HdeD (DUF308 family)